MGKVAARTFVYAPYRHLHNEIEVNPEDPQSEWPATYMSAHAISKFVALRCETRQLGLQRQKVSKLGAGW